MRKIKLFLSDFYNVYLTVIATLVSLPIIAPIFLKLGLVSPAKIIYFIYSFFCHQFASRSIDLFDYQIAWCARDTGIWIGIFVTALLVKFNKLPKLRWYWTIPFIIPMGLDGGLQTIFTFLNINPLGDVTGMPLYVSNNFSRFMTGAIFGIGLGWWLAQQLRIASQEGKVKNIDDLFPKFNHIKDYVLRTILIVLGMGVGYFGLVALWNVTSVNNKPLDALDAAVKTPATDFFARRGNGICPTQGVNDILDLECFFGIKQ